MRLLLTTDTVGGVWTFACELAGELLRLGHSVALVSFGGQPSDSHMADLVSLTDSGNFCFFVAEAPLEWQPDNQNAYTAGAPLLLRVCEEFRPDVLVLSQFCFGALPTAVPKIVVAHSDVLSWADAVGKAPLAEDAWLQTYRRLVQEGLEGADTIIAPTAAVLADLKRNFKLLAEAHVIPNGRAIEVPAGNPGKRQLCAVTAGRMWDPAKDLQLLLKQQLSLTLFVAGQNEAGLQTGEQVSLLGQLSSKALLDLLRASAIYICCSVYEPFGLAPLEAALCGCALVVRDIPSLREVWADGALYFHDEPKLVATLNALVENPDLLTAAQQRSRERAHGYSAKTMTDGYLRVIESLPTRASEGVLAT